MNDDRLFEVYRLLDHKVACLRNQRLSYSRTFIIFNSVLPGALLFALLGNEKPFDLFSMETTEAIILIVSSVIGVVGNLAWYLHIRYIQDWNFLNYAQLFLLEDEIGVYQPHLRPYHIFVNVYFPNAIHPIANALKSYQSYMFSHEKRRQGFSNSDALCVDPERLNEGLEGLHDARETARNSQRDLSFTKIEMFLPQSMMVVWTILMVVVCYGVVIGLIDWFRLRWWVSLFC